MTLQMKEMMSMFGLPSKVRSKFGSIKTFPGVRNTSAKPFGHFCSNFVSRPTECSPCFSACFETQVKGASTRPADVLDCPANSPRCSRAWRILRDKSGKADVLPDFRVKHRPKGPSASFHGPLFRKTKLRQAVCLLGNFACRPGV